MCHFNTILNSCPKKVKRTLQMGKKNTLIYTDIYKTTDPEPAGKNLKNDGPASPEQTLPCKKTTF